MKQCYFCFEKFGDEFDVCPHCGKVYNPHPSEPIFLEPGTVLDNRYIIGQSVGAGGFGIVYVAWDPVLQTVLAIKEFYVSRLVTRAQGQKDLIISKKSRDEYDYRKARFLAEARAMAKFNKHRSIPNVYDFFEENGTAYIVMELLKGEALNAYRNRNNGKMDVDYAVVIANEVGKALISLHEEHVYHCDVAPDNIFICEGDKNKIKLMDLGAAKLGEASTDVVDIILKPGYSPIEQYDNNNNIGPWTDVYALGATLYVMLTGVKPDESTNRAIQDTLVPPKVLNPEISENLNNAILKAMAVNIHMRFQKVSEFLEAVNGERQVISLEEEKKKRSRKRVIRVAIACAVVVIALIAGLFVFNNKRAEGKLDPAVISVWYRLENGTDEENAMASIKQQFEDVFPDVTLEMTSFLPEEYEQALLSAKANGTMPTLFESTGVDEALLESALDLEAVIDSEQFEEAMFLNQYADYYGESKKQIPLGIEIPVMYVITNGPACVSFASNYAADLSEFGAGTRIAADERYAELICENYPSGTFCGREEFLNNEENTSPVLLSSSMIANEVRTTITNYEKRFVFPMQDQIFCRFTYEWSIGGGNEAEVRAAERLLSWMLGNVYQQTLMVGACNDGQIPVNAESFEYKLQTSGYLAPVKEIYRRFVFRMVTE